MAVTKEKAKRLEQIARLYYLETRTQDEIARRLGVSRPLISRLLREARQLGLVEIRIHSLEERDQSTLDLAREHFGLEGGRLAPEEGGDAPTNRALAEIALDYLHELGGGRLGLGWGHIIGTLVSLLEEKPVRAGSIKEVCPMVGNSGVSIRNYHSNENVRIVAQQTASAPHYLYTPAFAETRREMELLEQTEHYQAVRRLWEKLDLALVNIGNHPSTPDFASQARYGQLLTERQAVGRLIAYYFDLKGEIIQSDFDYAIQIPLPLLKRCPKVVGICSANTHWRALAGALRSGYLTHLLAPEHVLRRVWAEEKL